MMRVEAPLGVLQMLQCIIRLSRCTCSQNMPCINPVAAVGVSVSLCVSYTAPGGRLC